MAYIAVFVVPGLCVYPARWKPQPCIPEPCRRFSAHRALAWSLLELYCLGNVEWSVYPAGKSFGGAWKKERAKVLRTALGWIYTIFVVNLGWVLFRAGSLSAAAAYMGTMFGAGSVRTGYTAASFVDGWTFVVFAAGILFSAGLPSRAAKRIAEKANQSVILTLQCVSALFLLFASMLRVVSGVYNPFIYFQF